MVVVQRQNESEPLAQVAPKVPAQNHTATKTLRCIAGKRLEAMSCGLEAYSKEKWVDQAAMRSPFAANPSSKFTNTKTTPLVAVMTLINPAGEPMAAWLNDKAKAKGHKSHARHRWQFKPVNNLTKAGAYRIALAIGFKKRFIEGDNNCTHEGIGARSDVARRAFDAKRRRTLRDFGLEDDPALADNERISVLHTEVFTINVTAGKRGARVEAWHG